MFKINNLKICDFFVGMWGLYYLQGILYPSGIINQVLQLVMICFGLHATIKCLLQKNLPRLLKATLYLIVMYMIYGGIVILFDDGISVVSNTYYLKNSFNSLLPIFFFYYYTRRNGILNEARIRYYCIFCTMISIIVFMYMGQTLVNDIGADEVTNNMGYMFVSLIPMLYFFYRTPLIQYILLLTCLFFVILGMKRGAIMVGAISMLIFLASGLKGGGKKRKTITFTLAVSFVVVATLYIGYMVDNSQYFSQRIEQTKNGDSSNRDFIYGNIWNASINETNVLNILFGHGANSTVRQCGTFAHQDWLETLYNNGLFGVLILASFYIIFLRTVLKSKRRLPVQYYFCFMTLFVMSFLKTLFSMSIQDMNISQSMLIGYFAYVSSAKGQMQKL